MASLVGQESVWKECYQQLDAPSHIFITGSAGCGKTTLIRELLQIYAREKGRATPFLWGVESIDECMLLGPDQDRGIQTIRGQVSLFIRQMSLGKGIYRWVVIDDVDTFPHISQQALRRPMESYSHITRFFNHEKGHGCPKCVSVSSKVQIQWLEYRKISDGFIQHIGNMGEYVG